jgi:hypothetical protein
MIFSSATSGTFTITAFILMTQTCDSSDIIYSEVVTTDAGQDNSFISFNRETRIISWTTPTFTGVYTVTVTGII